jgi:hypothetical protein
MIDNTTSELLQWYNDFKLTFDHSLILDRQFLSDIENKVSIASIDEPTNSGEDDLESRKSAIEALQVIYAEKYDNTLQFRELPISLSRLYFSGRNRIRRFIRNLNNWQLDRWLDILENDYYIPKNSIDEFSTRKRDDWSNPVYDNLCDAIEQYVIEILDLCLTSFETCMNRTIDLLTKGEWLSANLFYDLRDDAHWRYFPIIFPLDKPLTQDQLLHSGHLIWLVSTWRINTARMISRLLSPWENTETEEWIEYKMKLFCDHHLDLLTEMSVYRIYNDNEIYYETKILQEFYPSAHRVICAEEMPDFIIYLTDNFKTGTNLKERNTKDEKFAHIYANKTGPNICKIRNLFDICIRYGEQHPLIYESLKNILRCMLLGNVPKSKGHLSMLARIKINMSFRKDETDCEIPLDTFREYTKNKSLKRDKHTGEEQLIYTKTNFKLLFLLCRHFFLYLLKEYLIYTAECSICFDEFCTTTYKGVRNKEIIRLGNGRCRDILSRQARVDRPFDWSEIEFEEKSTVDQDIKSGEIKKIHHWSLGLSNKIRKDKFLHILAKKMTGTEKHIPLRDLECPNFYQDSLVEGEIQKKITLDEFHFICWYIANTKTDFIETKWFKVMGMTKYGLKHLRNWQFCYYRYDIPDNSLNDRIEDFRIHSMNDYYILKTAIHVILLYSITPSIFVFSMKVASNHIYGMRRTLNIGDYEPTPSQLGIAHQCRGCMKFANSITIAFTDEQKMIKQAQLERARILELNAAASKKKNGGDNNKTETRAQKTKKMIQNNTSYSFLNKTFYNVDDGRLYCTKYINPFNKQIPNLDNMTVIIKKKDSSVIIESSRPVPVKLVMKPPKTTTTTNNKKQQQPSNGFFCNEKHIRDRAEKKLEWLLQTSARTALTEGNVDGKKNNKKNDNTDDDIIGGDENNEDPNANMFTPITDIGSKKRKDNIKKIIHNRITDAITKMNFTCQAPLMKVDMIGIYKNGKVYCEVCSLMTEMGNHNKMSDGRITCGRHPEWFHPPPAPGFTKNGNNQKKDGGAGRLPGIKYRLNPIDLIDIKLHVKCHFCPIPSKFRFPVITHLFKIEKICLCKDCFDRIKSPSSTATDLHTYENVCNRFK